MFEAMVDHRLSSISCVHAEACGVITVDACTPTTIQLLLVALWFGWLGNAPGAHGTATTMGVGSELPGLGISTTHPAGPLQEHPFAVRQIVRPHLLDPLCQR